MQKPLDPERKRLLEDSGRLENWKRWGPYLSAREWGTVREDYSPHGSAWEYFPHDHARSRAYRWGEDGIGGICDRHQFICFAMALWNGKDPILKERYFGLTGNEGNHGEDVKEYYYFLDSTPTHSYMKFLYKYPQQAYPYNQLLEENRHRGKQEFEYELVDTGIFNENRYFDVYVEYAKNTSEDILIRIQVINRSPEAAEIDILPTMWFRDTWSWGLDIRRPHAKEAGVVADTKVVHLNQDYYGDRWLYCEGNPDLLFTHNETNKQRLWNTPNDSLFVKDGIDSYIVHGNKDAVNPAQSGTKMSAHYHAILQSGEKSLIRLRFSNSEFSEDNKPFEDYDRIFVDRIQEADDFYDPVIPQDLSEDARNVMRQALAGMLWNKQFYQYDVPRWLRGDPAGPTPPKERENGRNSHWNHLFNADVISMPDNWEYPWYAAWDLAFHCIPLALIDPDYAKQQLILLLREWYMHPNGQLPAYEWAFGDVNPPVHAWAAWRVYKIDEKRSGKSDKKFLERVFHKLLLNFTWWVNRKDTTGRNVFQGGFLGLDNIGVFDRSAPLPTGGHLEQSDGTSWMGMYCLNMMTIALELAGTNPAYEDVASKFFEHFVYICRAMNNLGEKGLELWDMEDHFYYDVLQLPDGKSFPLRVRSMVGLIPLFAVETLDSELVDKLPGFKRRMQWFIENRPDLSYNVETETVDNDEIRRFLCLVQQQRLHHVLKYMLDENEFFSPHGIRALSRYHHEHPYSIDVQGTEYRVEYEPAESRTGLFGGNSNWRGPVWFPVNFLIIESLQKFHYYLGDGYKVECPTGSGQMMNLWQVAGEIAYRLVRIFLKDENGKRPVHGGVEKLQTDPHWKDNLLFFEYFNGDNGAGLGANHQTGWTGLVAKLLQQRGEYRKTFRNPQSSNFE